MVRDFLGIGGNDSGAKDSCGDRMDSAAAFSVVQWPFSNKPSSMQQLKPFKTQQEEKPKNVFFDLLSSNSSNPNGSFAATDPKACAVQAPQISIGVDRHNVQQFALHNYQNQDIDNYRLSARVVPVSSTSIPIGTSSPLFKIHGSSNGPNPAVAAGKSQPFRPAITNSSSLLGVDTGSFTPRNATKYPQLTIFYAGSVNVYDDVPWDKAQALMLKASEGCRATTNVAHSTAEAPSLPLSKGTQKATNNHAASLCSSLSSAFSLPSRKGNQSESSSMITDDMVVARRIGIGQEETSMTMNSSMVAVATAAGAAAAAATVPRAVPQARKASLARFLEKRKERVSNTGPYSFEKELSQTVAGAAVPFSDPQFSWFKARAKSCADNGGSPSTKLEM